MQTLRHTLTTGGTLFTALLIFAGHSAAQTTGATLTTLRTFVSVSSDGQVPSGMAMGSGGVLYGVTGQGGAWGFGTVFALAPPTGAPSASGGAWTETVLYNFTGGSDGASPASVAIGSGGVLYGTTYYGGGGTDICVVGCGTVFAVTPPALASGAWTESVLYRFTGRSDGGSPTAGVVIGSNGVLYGTTSAGGTANRGTVFSLTPPKGTASGPGAWTEAVLYSFAGGNDGTSPNNLTIDSRGALYGTTTAGGAGRGLPCFSGCGTVFSLTPPKGAPSGPGAWTETVLYNFTGGTGDFEPQGVVIGNGGILYGTALGGASSAGTVFSLTPPAGTASGGGTWTETLLYSFTGGADDGANPAGVTIGSGGVLYGTATGGGASQAGVVFSLTPPAGPSPGSGGTWTESVLYSFMGGNGGAHPTAGVLLGDGGVLYGATASGGAAGAGTVFSLTPPKSTNSPWTESVLYAFTGGSPGVGALSGVVVGDGGVLYGTTEGGGAGSCPTGCGTIFSLTPPSGPGAGWTESVLYSFTGGDDGAYPVAGVTIGPAGVLYGTTEYGGTGSCTAAGMPPGCGVVFSLTPPTSAGGAWTENTLYRFNPGNGTCHPTIGCSGYTDGFYPTTSVAIGGGPGEQPVLYGTTGAGGTSASGTVFSLTPLPGGAWSEAVLYDFTAYGAYYYPTSAGPSSLAIGGGVVLYGTTYGGGNTSFYCADSAGCGTVFSLTPPSPGPGGAWTEATLYSFTGDQNNAANPTAGVVIGSDGVLYGSTQGGSTYQGTVSSFTPPAAPGGEWTTAVVYNFTGASDGGSPSGVAIGSGGVLYGTTLDGGAGPCTAFGNKGCGTVFALVPPPSPDGTWAEATLYNFTGGSDGRFPTTGVVSGAGGVLYGTTEGATRTGTVFSLNVGDGLSPSINAGGVVNAASYTAPVAPGSIASAFGGFLLTSPLGATQSPLPDDISGLALQFAGGTLAPLFYVSSRQVNFQVPWEVPIQSQSVLATLDNAAGAAQTVNVAPLTPAIFSTNAAGSGQGAILDTSYRLVDLNNPTTAGNFVLIYCTGLGAVSNQPATGSPAPSDPLAWSATPTVTIGGVTANVQFSGLAPGYVGLYQVNAQVPAGSATGPDVPVVISMGDVTSNTVTLAVR